MGINEDFEANFCVLSCRRMNPRILLDRDFLLQQTLMHLSTEKGSRIYVVVFDYGRFFSSTLININYYGINEDLEANFCVLSCRRMNPRILLDSDFLLQQTLMYLSTEKVSRIYVVVFDS